VELYESGFDYVSSEVQCGWCSLKRTRERQGCDGGWFKINIRNRLEYPEMGKGVENRIKIPFTLGNRTQDISYCENSYISFTPT
jgi:hypothetical protein